MPIIDNLYVRDINRARRECEARAHYVAPDKSALRAILAQAAANTARLQTPGAGVTDDRSNDRSARVTQTEPPHA